MKGSIALRNDKRHPFQAMALMSAILSQLVGSILVGIFVGKWLDEKTGTTPFLLIFGLLLGLAAGVFGTIHLIRRFSRDESS